MKHQIIFHPLARLELFESKRWYAEKSLIALRKFQVEVTTLLSILEEEPEIFQIVYWTKRIASLKSFPIHLFMPFTITRCSFLLFFITLEIQRCGKRVNHKII